MRVAVGSDYKNAVTDAIVSDLQRRGHTVETYGALQASGEQWVEIAQRVAEQVATGACDQGVLMCWTGTGVSIVANKVPEVRAALCTDAETARGARLWNDANVLCLSIRLTSEPVAKEILDAWFQTLEIDPSEAENIQKMRDMDRRVGGIPSRMS
ncbi:MAG: RpiB/LacA/LacB family sugar-phosphate isomerase [Chloroflexi bacterium]|nr:RpiB/LacA/LacB family sugar-phosphate isomerase [Chloroflexota bacterium]